MGAEGSCTMSSAASVSVPMGNGFCPAFVSTGVSIFGKPRLHLAARQRRSLRTRVLYCSVSVSVGTASDKATQSLQDFLAWFRGDFDNYYQCAEERRQGVGRGAHEHMHCRLTPIQDEKLDAKGEALVFANYYYNGRSDVVFRQRMYKIFAGTKDIEMQIYKMQFLHGLKVAECEGNFASFDLGDLDDTSLYERLHGAEVFWRYENSEHPGSDLVCNGPHFIGYMQEGGWTSEKETGGFRVEDDLVFTKEDLWVAERMYTADGTMIGGNKEGVPHKMQRVRPDDEIRWTVNRALDFIDIQ